MSVRVRVAVEHGWLPAPARRAANVKYLGGDAHEQVEKQLVCAKDSSTAEGSLLGCLANVPQDYQRAEMPISAEWLSRSVLNVDLPADTLSSRSASTRT